MQDSKINTNRLKISKFVYFAILFLFLIFLGTLSYRCLIDYKATDKVTISDFIKNRNIYDEVLLPSRGTIYDNLGNPLAQDVSSYTLIAYLDESRSKDSTTLRHVEDKEGTALKLSEYIDMDYEKILERLSKDAYQVEFGVAGKNLTQTKMEEIEGLNLAGIDFIKSTKRYYANGDFASYLLGYTTNKEIDNNTYMVGELGIEGYYNEELTGSNGYITYEKDGRGNKIANSNEYIEQAIDGSDIYLTIDSSIQLFIEKAVKNTQEESDAEWVLMGVMDAKTGAILGYSSTPSFDPNIKNLTNYLDPLVSYTYEPGSTMKTFSYMCAIDSGKYNGSDTFLSGSKTYTSKINESDKVTIKDWNNGLGWGTISYDFGYAMSSNIAVANLIESVISTKELKECYSKYGFGKKTGISLNNEYAGNTKITYEIEAATAGYGQGITVSPIQMLQGLSIISNDGVMLKPYVVSKIVNSSGVEVLSNSRNEIGRVASEKTVKKMKELMRSVVSSDSSLTTGSAYYIDGYDLIGKTGTAEIWENGGYLTGSSDYIYSFSGIYPGDDPEIIIYMAVKKPKDSNNYIAKAVKDVVVNTAKYLNISEDNMQIDKYEIGDYSNRVVTEVVDELSRKNLKVITLGTGSRIIDQYPKNMTLSDSSLVVILTNDYNKEMIDFSGLSYKEVKIVLDLMDVSYDLVDYGYAYEQNIASGVSAYEKKVVVKFKKIY